MTEGKMPKCRLYCSRYGLLRFFELFFCLLRQKSKIENDNYFNKKLHLFIFIM